MQSIHKYITVIMKEIFRRTYFIRDKRNFNLNSIYFGWLVCSHEYRINNISD